MNHILTIFLAWGSSDSVAKRITRQTSDREDCSSNPPGGECIYTNVKKLGLSGIRTRISCVEAQCPNHITNASERGRGKKFDATLQTIAGKLQWNCSGITAMHFELQWIMACSETLQLAEVNSCKFCSDPNAKSFAVIICRNCSEILHCQNCI